ncbi:hypothetical protein IID10_18615, partial [candidate division KSB1 bacterium]|nr:hypothetical protein [candidate division KSB1 bacterium]
FKIVDAANAVRAAEGILIDLRKMEKNIHKNNENRENIVDNYVNIVIKDEDQLVDEIAGFILDVKKKIDEIKQKDVAEGYLDIIRDLKNLEIEFTQ